jgi:hypothetical protein
VCNNLSPMTNPAGKVINTHSTTIFRECILAVAACLVVSSVAILPFFRIGERPGSGCCGGAMPVTHDMVMHLNQMQAFYDGLSSGRLYPRWNEPTNRGFGAPTTIFYPPLTYYITSLLYFLSGNWMTVIVLFYLGVMTGSGMAFFALARSLYGRWPALMATATYTVTPYHLLNHYQRGALAECVSFIFIPLMALFLMRLMRTTGERTIRWAAVLSVTWGLFIWSHPPTAYQFQLIALPVLVIAGVIARWWRGLVSIVAALFIGTMISAAYLLPAVVEQKAVHAEDVEHSWPYHESYVLNWSSSRYDHVQDDFVVRVDRIWVYTTLLLGFVGALLVVARKLSRRRGEEEEEESDFRPWLAASLLASVMMLPISRFIGVMIPGIGIGVFAWRMLALTSTGLSVLIGYLASLAFHSEAFQNRGRRVLAVVLIASCVAVALVSVRLVILPMYRAEAFEPNPDHSNYSLVPAAGSREQPIRPDVSFVEGSGLAQIKIWEPEHRVIDLEMSERGRIGLRLFNYPGWMARNQDGEVVIRTGTLGEIQVELPAGHHELTLEFQNTWLRSLAVVLSLCGAIVAAASLALSSREVLDFARSKRGARWKTL